MFPLDLESPENTAFIALDIQADFCEGGSLAAPQTGPDYIHDVDQFLEKIREKNLLLFFTQDWHPSAHVSFASTHGKQVLERIMVESGKEQILWPDHCVNDSEGARLKVKTKPGDRFVQKGTHVKFDSLSAFFDDNQISTGLHEALLKEHVTEVVIFGLCLDYCVFFSALHAASLGYRVRVLSRYSRSVHPHRIEETVAELRKAGVQLV